MRFLRQTVIGFFLAALTLALLAYAAQIVGSAIQERMSNDRKAPPARERVFSVNVATAQSERAVPVLETFGEVTSRRRLELRAAVAGRVIWLAEAFEDGGEVTQGQALLRIDPSDAQAVVDRLQADFADAEAEQREAVRGLALAQDESAAARDQADLRQRAYQRQVDLQDRGVGTSTAVEAAELAASAAHAQVLARRQAHAQAQARIDQAATRLTRTQIALDEAQRKLADTTVYAPFTGTLGATNVVEGRLVSMNERLAELIDPNNLEVSARISTAQYVRLLDDSGEISAAKIRAILDVAGVDLTASGTITRASAGAGGGQTGRVIFATLEEPIGFKTGDFVTVQVQEPALENVIRLPALAVDAASSVLVLAEGDRLESEPVQIMRRQGDDILVRAPALDGREVVLARSPLLGAGIAVKPLRTGAAPEAPAMVELTEERRAKLMAFVKDNAFMPQEAKDRVLARLAEPQVPLKMIERIESRMGG
jgi:multidrug efflux pump subunit AcrA (membrane-fusion protein)